jgi:hypothetical protein
VIKLTSLTFMALLFGSGSVHAQTQPDRRGEYTSPDHNGVWLNAPIPREYHIRNEGGSNGAGLCVISAIIMNGAAAGIADFRLLKNSKLWKSAKARPGGYSPQKLAALLKELYPELEWASVETADAGLIRKYSAAGYQVANTMNTGQQYKYMPIHHFISTVHADLKMSCIVDNNDPGVWHWFSAAEQDRRFPDGQTGWLVVLLQRRKSFAIPILAFGIIAGSGILCLGKKRINCLP